MPTQFDFKIPSWVPKSIRDEALSLLRNAQDEKSRELLRRLLTNDGMRHVWKELTKQKRDARTYKPTGHFYEQQQTHKLPDDWFKQETGLRYFLARSIGRSFSVNNLAKFFRSAYYLALDPPSVLTEEKVLEARGRLNNTVKQCESLASEFKHWNRHPWVSDRFVTHFCASTLPKSQRFHLPDNLCHSFRWTDLKQVADELGKFALYFNVLTGDFRPQSPVVKRRTARDHERAYVLNLARTCGIYFGSPLYSVIAHTASVAFGKDIKPAFVKRCIQRN